MVPIVEPEVLMDGSHNIEKCYQVTTEVLNECYNELEIHKVDLKGTVLKPNMVLPGSDCKDKSSHEEIAQKTLDCLKKNVPSNVPGIAFLSGGQSEIFLGQMPKSSWSTAKHRQKLIKSWLESGRL